MVVRRLATLTAAAVVLALAPQVARATPAYAPLDRPGPKLSVSASRLNASLTCQGNPAGRQQGVLLNPATTVTPDQNYSWNYEKAFTAQHRYWCAVTVPFHTTGDIQVAAEYIVHAIRVMHRRTDKRVDILGHSQGGMSLRWALRFWPDTRAMVDDVVGFAGTNHGSTAFGQQCLTGVTTCPPAMWQQRAGSAFIKALNSRTETFRGIDYTEIWTHTDEVVTPAGPAATATSALRTGHGHIADVATQDVCPANISEHVTLGTSDAVAYALAMDALNHRGPADPARIDRSVCSHLYQPYVDPADLSLWLEVLEILPGLGSAELPFVNTFGSPSLKAEPKLRSYVFR
ncbi:lipase family alpha/beta hydrolase [Nocardioides montaniterrae]